MACYQMASSHYLNQTLFYHQRCSSNCFYTHSSLILLFISLVALQLGKKTPKEPSCERWNSSSLEYIHYSLYSCVHSVTSIQDLEMYQIWINLHGHNILSTMLEQTCIPTHNTILQSIQCSIMIQFLCTIDHPRWIAMMFYVNLSHPWETLC